MILSDHIDGVDQLNASIDRTVAIASVVTWNFVNGCKGYHSLDEYTVASLMFQIQENMDRMTEISSALHEFHDAKRTMRKPSKRP